jgi:23S rRNA (adenine2503-C2)-methyltransferase
MATTNPATNLLELTPAEIVALVEGWGEPAFRGRQVAAWVYQRGVRDFAAMTDLAKPLRARLAEETVVAVPEVAQRVRSRDGSQKLVLRLSDGRTVHAVLMPDEDRLTLCVSTQVGCGFGCAFCFTGTMGLVRNLTAGEIVGQVFAAREVAGAERLTHVVYMGMGEPLANYAATVKSLRILTDPRGFGFSPRRITVSTVGLVQGIEKLARESLRVRLAISLHAATDEVRSRLMPVNRGGGLDELLAACRRFPLPVRQRMTFEYVLLDGVNDSLEDARRLARRLGGIRAKVNLIPFNGWSDSGFRRPTLERIEAFQDALLDAGLLATVRWSKGEDVGAACGQLQTTERRKLQREAVGA